MTVAPGKQRESSGRVDVPFHPIWLRKGWGVEGEGPTVPTTPRGWHCVREDRRFPLRKFGWTSGCVV